MDDGDALVEDCVPPRGERGPSRLVRAITWAVGAVLVVLAVLVLALAGLVVLAPTHHDARPHTRSDAQAVRSAVLLYLGQSPGAECPTMSELVESGTIDHSRRTTDAWDHPFRIACEGYDIIVRSDGPDGVPGTADDIE